MKTTKILSVLMASFMMAIIFQCTNDDDAITYSVTEVNDRVTGFGTEKAGTGAPLTVNGSNLDKVVRLFVGNLVVPAKSFTSVSESSITFTVPSASSVGDNQLLFIFPGSERAFSSIEVIPFQAVTDFVPTSASEGETVTIRGANLNVVTSVKIGNVPVAITGQTPSVIKFTVPAGISSEPITLVSEAGSSTTSLPLTSCSASPAISDCSAGLNLNSGFELGSGDNFNNWNKFNGGTKIIATTNVDGGEVFRGSRALKVIRDATVVPATDQWRIQLASDFVPTDNGASYTVYAWVRASTAGAAFRFSNQDAAQYGADTPVPTIWTRISWTFTSNAAQKRIVLDLNGGPVTTFFIDDVKLVKN
jgi:hypothetical protein